MTRTDMILAISAKLQKQMHMITSAKQQANPKMLCDNLALRVLAVIDSHGMLPPAKPDDVNIEDLQWEPEDV